MVEMCYAAWLKERHAAAERYLFPDAVDALVETRRLFPEAYIGAITNGAGDPRAIPSLQPFFQFRVSGEDCNIFPFRKPHSRIYEAALDEYNGTIEKDTNIWCHVGDCLANDVRASALCGAHAIWLAHDIKEKNDRQSAWSTATTQELERRAKQAEEGKQLAAAQISSLSQWPKAIAEILKKNIG
jgi:FMN phosphatase YigB (HAD superfamily)